MLKYHLAKAQRKMKQQAGKHRINRPFEVGDLVYVKLQPYRQHFVALRTSQKLLAKFFRPFPVVAKIRAVAYKFQLPDSSRIHPVFHISQLKKHVGAHPVQSTLPEVDEARVITAVLVAVLDTKLGKHGYKAVVYALIQWSTGSRLKNMGVTL